VRNHSGYVESFFPLVYGVNSNMDKFICIHGHFYQPPRENPWLEDVELQDKAYPYHDWNAKVTQECYRQNAASRILGPDKKIIDIVNNYKNISFDFGPTLMYWLQSHAQEVYDKVIEADKKSMEAFSGHGSAIAQAYNHIILPLANDRDKHTQIIWGLTDFQSRFGRKPEGMWLPETAVDLQTLEILAEYGIKFTILAPRQAKQIRKTGKNQWQKVSENDLDTTMPYLCNLPSGKSINLFFYNGSVSHDVAYGGLLHSGENFASRLAGSFNKDNDQAQLIHIATDGESFGHHHRHGDMALAYCLHYIETNNLAKITTYGEYLEKFPPTHEVQIWENSSWSCVHGVERWRSNCGCCGDQSLSGQQQWREPLRNALDRLRDKFADAYEQMMSQYCSDPWQIRNQYINVINNRAPENIDGFIKNTIDKKLSYEDKVICLKLLEAQRNAMLMYTSCGWFFDNISGLETLQVMQYAARAMQLHHEVTKTDLVDEFKSSLKKAPGNRKELNNGKEVFEACVEPALIDLNRVGAHFALSSIFEEQPQGKKNIYCYSASVEDYDRAEAGIQVLATGRSNIQSGITLEKYVVDFAVLHLGDHNLMAALASPMSDESFQQMRQHLKNAFHKGDTNEVMRQMNIRFGDNNFSLWHLFKDQQRQILYELLENTWKDIESSFRRIYEHNYAIMLMIRGMNMPLPKALSAPAEFILNQDLCSVLKANKIDLNSLQNLTDETLRLSLELDETTLRFEAAHRINQLMGQLEKFPDDVQLLKTIEGILTILSKIVPGMDLQLAQNVFFTIGKQSYHQIKKKAEGQDQDAQKWVELFESLGRHLDVVVQ